MLLTSLFALSFLQVTTLPLAVQEGPRVVQKGPVVDQEEAALPTQAPGVTSGTDAEAAPQKDSTKAPADVLERAMALDLSDARIRARVEALADKLLTEHPRDIDLRGVAVKLGNQLGDFPVDTDEGPNLTEGELMIVLLEKGVNGSRAVQEAVLERMIAASSRKDLLEFLKPTPGMKSWKVRSFGFMAMGRLFPKEDARQTIKHAIYDPSEQAREAASRAVGDIGVFKVAQPIVNALNSQNADVRMRAIESLANTRHPAFVEPLLDRLFLLKAPKVKGFMPKLPAPAPAPRAGGSSSGGPVRSYLFVGRQQAYIQDFDVEVAQFSSIADPVINTLTTGSVLEVAVVGVSDVRFQTEVKLLQAALRKITNQNPGPSPTAWHGWWIGDGGKPYREINEQERSRRTEISVTPRRTR